MTRLAYLSTDPGIAFGGTKGASIHVEELVTALADEGADVLLVVASLAPGAVPPEGVAVEPLPGPGKGASVDDRLAAEPARAAWLEERLERFGADVLYERLALHSRAGSLAARALGIPHVVELNAPLPLEAERYRSLHRPAAARRIESEVLSRADLVLAVSRPLARYARERGARRVEVVPNAVALDRVAPERQRDGGPPVAVFAGSLRPWHGIDTIAEAWVLLGREAPGLLVVGDGPGRSLLEEAGAHVTGAVPHSAVPSLLGSADIGLAPYALDAPDYYSPLKLFEYLAAGLATIAANLPGVCDIVSAETAVLVPRGNARALAEAVASLAEDADRRERLGRAGNVLVAARHTWAHRAHTVLELAGKLARDEVAA